MDVFDEHDQRLLARDFLEQAPHGPERLSSGGGARRRADRAEHARSDELAVLGAGERGSHAFVAPEQADDLDERPEGDPVAVRQASSGQDRRLVAHGRAELCRQPGLADSGWPDDREQAARARLERLGVCLTQRAQLGLAADQRRVEPARVRTGALDHRQDVPRREAIGLAFQRQLVARLQHDRVLDQSPRRLADEDLARARRLLEPLRDVDGVSGDEHLAAGAVACDHLTAVDADADADPHLQLPLELLVQLGERLAELGRGAHRPQRVVLVQLRDAEDGHDRVADELLHRPAVPLEHDRHLLEEAGHHPPQRLRVEPLAQRRRIRDVCEQDGDRAPTDGHVLSVGLPPRKP